MKCRGKNAKREDPLVEAGEKVRVAAYLRRSESKTARTSKALKPTQMTIYDLT
jgi:hypothetical protein